MESLGEGPRNLHFHECFPKCKVLPFEAHCCEPCVKERKRMLASEKALRTEGWKSFSWHMHTLL